jgi:hypothetical protein
MGAHETEIQETPYPCAGVGQAAMDVAIAKITVRHVLGFRCSFGAKESFDSP